MWSHSTIQWMQNLLARGGIFLIYELVAKVRERQVYTMYVG